MLDGGQAVIVDLTECVAEGEEVDCAHRWFAEHVVGNGNGEGDALPLDPFLLARIDALQVQVRDARMVPAEEGDGVATTVCMMSRIKTERYLPRIGLVKE